MLKRLSIGGKLSLLLLVISAVAVGITAVLLLELKSSMLEGRKLKLRALVESATNIADTYSQMAAEGTLSEEDAKRQAVTAISSMNYDGNNYFFIVDTDGVLVWHPSRQEQIGVNLLKGESDKIRKLYGGFISNAKTSARLEGYSNAFGRRPGSNENNVAKMFLSATDKRWNWVITTGLFVDDIESTFYERAAIFLGLAAVGLLIGLGLSYMVVRSITRPVNRTVSALEDLSEGRTDTDVESDNSATEVGRLTRAFNHFREKIIEAEELREQKAIAEQQAEQERREALLGFADEFERSVGAAVTFMNEEVGKVSDASSEMSQSAENSATGTQQVNTAAKSTAKNVQTVASAAQELTASISEIQRQVSTVQSVVGNTRTRSDQTEEQMSALAGTVEKIGSVVELINSIAEQTNLLALNATIEAARAGDAGKGFAVVAGEVKVLATQTKQATEDIREQITILNDATGQCVGSIKDVATSVDDLLNSTTAIAAAIEEQNAATAEISRNTDITAQETQSITQAIGDVSASVQITETTAQSVSQTSAMMQEKADMVSREVQNFLQRVRTT
ncbi:MAG: methyl-accepting chemotaxis protein [Nisaea sp.]